MSDAALLGVQVQIDGQALTALEVEIELAVSEIGTCTCVLTDNDGGPDPATLIGQTLELSVTREADERSFTFAGLIIEAEHLGAESALPAVKLVSVSRLWRLSMRSDTRVFQEMTTESIVADVLSRAGIDPVDQDWKLTGSYEPRLHCVQHRETDLAFIKRLLAEEGISFTVEIEEGVDKIRFSDVDFGEVLGPLQLTYQHEFGMDAARDHVARLEYGRAIVSDRVTVRDFDFERPDFEVKAEQAADGAGTLEDYLYPARAIEPDTIERRAQVRLESHQAERATIRGGTGALHLLPGRRFSITGHPYEPLNIELRVLTVSYQFVAPRWGKSKASGDVQRMSFTAMPAELAMRPKVMPNARSVPGYDLAQITGPAGSEIHPDEYGRTKLQALWDHTGKGDDQSSCWVRSTQLPLAGGLMTPRVGWEVAVRHVEGDPDEPIIVGRMYNAKKPPPYALPEHKARSTIQTATSPGGEGVNELRFDDTKGKEQMMMNASKNMSVAAGNNCTDSVVGDETRSIGVDQNLDVSGALQSNVGGSQTWGVGADQKTASATYLVDEMGGAHSLAIGGNRDLTVGGDHRALVSGTSELAVGGMQIDLVAGSVEESTLSTMNDTVGGALIQMTPSGHNVVTSGSRVETIGALKAVLSTAGRGVKVGGAMTQTVGGAVAVISKGDIKDNSDGAISETVGGLHYTKATEVTYAAKSLLTVVCGGSTLTLTPASVTIAGATIKLDGVCPETAALVLDN